MELLKKNVKNISQILVKKDLDFVLGIVGYERVGKSTLALQIAQIVDKNFNVSKICFDIPQLYEAMYSSEKGSAILVDEGATSFFSREAMREEVREGVKLLTVCGERNIFLIICVPAFNLLDKYIREHRLQCLIKIKKRGYYRVYSPAKVKKIRFDNRTKKWVYPSCSFAEGYGSMKGELWEKYKRKKSQYLESRKEDMNGEWMTLVQARKFAERDKSTVWRWGKDNIVATKERKGRIMYNKKDISQHIGLELV